MLQEWLINGLGFLVLCVGMRIGRPRLLRSLCALAILYLVGFFIGYYLWLSAKYHAFLTQPRMVHLDISAAFRFEGFWRLFANIFLLQGLVPVVLVFILYFTLKWMIPYDRLRSGSF